MHGCKKVRLNSSEHIFQTVKTVLYHHHPHHHKILSQTIKCSFKNTHKQTTSQTLLFNELQGFSFVFLSHLLRLVFLGVNDLFLRLSHEIECDATCLFHSVKAPLCSVGGICFSVLSQTDGGPLATMGWNYTPRLRKASKMGGRKVPVWKSP